MAVFGDPAPLSTQVADCIIVRRDFCPLCIPFYTVRGTFIPSFLSLSIYKVYRPDRHPFTDPFTPLLKLKPSPKLKQN